MSRLAVFQILALSLMLSACGGSDEPSNHADSVASPAPQSATNGSSDKKMSNSSADRHSGPDIAGLYLGMKPEHVKAALAAYDASMRIQDTHRYFEYNALGKRYKTDGFLVATHGQGPEGSVSLAVSYSYPPGEPRVVAITRGHRQTTEPLTQADYATALIEKYGKPIEDISNDRTDARAERTLKWKLAETGKVNCVAGASVGNSVLDRFIKDGRKMADTDVTPEYAAQCAGLFLYTLRGEPVTSASGTIFDVWAQAKSEFEARDWVQQQVAEKSKTGTTAPKL